MCSLSHVNVVRVGNLVVALGRKPTGKCGDLSVYRIVVVYPDDRPLLGMEWQGALYVDTCLPFGLSLAP